jgi:hypothetical protein
MLVPNILNWNGKKRLLIGSSDDVSDIFIMHFKLCPRVPGVDIHLLLANVRGLMNIYLIRRTRVL